MSCEKEEMGINPKEDVNVCGLTRLRPDTGFSSSERISAVPLCLFSALMTLSHF